MPRRNTAAFLIATWFGCGYAPKAPGTAGSLAASVIAIALHYLVGYDAGHERLTLLLLTAILLAPGIWSASVVAKQTNIVDPHIVVVDEVIGQWITLAGSSHVQLENISRRIRFVPSSRRLEAAAGTPVRTVFRAAGASSPTT